MLREILEHAMQLEAGWELLTDSRSGLRMLTEPSRSPDVVILGLTAAQDATLLPALFAQWPRAQVVTVMPTGADTTVYELQPRQHALGDMSPTELVDTVREAVERRRSSATNEGH